MNKLFKISLRQLKGYTSKYIFLFIVITFSFTVITVMTGLTDSMRSSVKKAAELHYGGELFITGSDKQANTMLIIDDTVAVNKAILDSGLDVIKTYKRTNVLNTGLIYFNGKGVRHKNIYGVDFDIEYDDFLNVDYQSGSIPLSTKGLLLSTVTAKELKAEVGDNVLIKLVTRTGQINTGQFVVDGIISDSGIFGSYRCFIDRKELNSLLNIEEYKYSSIGLFLNEKISAEDASDILYNSAKKNLFVNDKILKKADLTFGFSKKWKGVKHFILPLSVYISQVSDLILVMDIISYLLYLMISVIIIISVYVSFNVLLQDRRIEFASMRALGMQRVDLIFIIVTESIFLLAVSIITGIMLSVLIFFFISNISFSAITGFEIFLVKGKLLPLIKLNRIIINVVILLISVLPSAFIPGNRISRKAISDGLIGR